MLFLQDQLFEKYPMRVFFMGKSRWMVCGAGAVRVETG
jgi:hypothetical protein